MPAVAPTPIPRTRTGGFGGFTPNPYISYPGGRVTTGEVQQATDAINFGGPISRAPVAPPAATPRPTATPPVTMDPSGAGYASSTLRPQPWSPRDRAPREDTGGDVAASADMSRPTMVASRGGRSPGVINDPSEDWRGNDPRATNPSLTVNPGVETAQAAPAYRPGGNDMAQFGGNMSLGQLLSTPLSTLLYSTGRWQPPVQGGDVLYADTRSHTAGDAPSTSEVDRNFAAAEARGAEETARLKASGELNQDATTGVVNASPVLSPEQYDRATFGGVTPTGYRDTTGSAVFDSHAANLLEMASQSFGGVPNNMRGTPEEGRNQFSPATGFEGRVDPETGIIERVRGGYNPAPTVTQEEAAAAPWGVGNTAATNAWWMTHQTPAMQAWFAAQQKKTGG